MHPQIAAAYDAAQDRAASQTIGWIAEHGTTRVGPCGRQVQVPVEEIDAAVVRHFTSRAGDPHRHLHLQINVRVWTDGRWCGLHTVGVRDSLDAINGIGHAAMMTDPEFRAALAVEGYNLDPETGEVLQIAFAALKAPDHTYVQSLIQWARLVRLGVAAAVPAAGALDPAVAGEPLHCELG